MTFETRDNSGALFKSNRKQSETHPDYDGNCRIDGHDYWISGWIKEGKNGKFFSLSFKRKDGTAARPQGYSAAAKEAAFKAQAPLDDPEIPF